MRSRFNFNVRYLLRLSKSSIVKNSLLVALSSVICFEIVLDISCLHLQLHYFSLGGGEDKRLGFSNAISLHVPNYDNFQHFWSIVMFSKVKLGGKYFTLEAVSHSSTSDITFVLADLHLSRLPRLLKSKLMQVNFRCHLSVTPCTFQFSLANHLNVPFGCQLCGWWGLKR